MTPTTYTYRPNFTVQLVQSVGDDAAICKAARVSTLGSDSLDSEESAGLINFLIKNRHGSPFEHGSMTYLIEAPIFVFREFHRHRVGWSYNEVSGRYKELEPVFYTPSTERLLVQIGKPGQYMYVRGTTEQHSMASAEMITAYEHAWTSYKNMLKDGVAKEVARVVLPVGIYSSMYATCNPRSLMHFLSLRTTDESSKFPSFPQWEIEQVARQMETIFVELYPHTYKAFVHNGRVSP